MDMRTGRTYASLEDARADGVPDSDIALVNFDADGQPRPSFVPSPKIRFSKGSFKPVAHAEVRKG